MAEIVVYTQPSCASCDQVQRFLRKQGVAFAVKDVGADPAAMAEFLPYGFLTTPLTVVDGTPVAGFQPKRLAGLLGSPRASACTLTAAKTHQRRPAHDA